MFRSLVFFFSLVILMVNASTVGGGSGGGSPFGPNYLPPGVSPCFTVAIPSSYYYGGVGLPSSTTRFISPYNSYLNLSIDGNEASSFYNALTSSSNFGSTGTAPRRFVTVELNSLASGSLNNVNLLFLPAVDEDILIPCNYGYNCTTTSLLHRDTSTADYIGSQVARGMSLWTIFSGQGILNYYYNLPTPLQFQSTYFQLLGAASAGYFGNYPSTFESNPSAWNATELVSFDPTLLPLSATVYNLTSFYTFFEDTISTFSIPGVTTAATNFYVIDGDIRHYTELFPPPLSQFTLSSSVAKLNVLSNILDNFCPPITITSSDNTGLGSCLSTSYNLTATGCAGGWTAPPGIVLSDPFAQNVIATILYPGSFTIYYTNCLYERVSTTLTLLDPVTSTQGGICASAKQGGGVTFTLDTLYTINCASVISNIQITNLPVNFSVNNTGNASIVTTASSITITRVSSNTLSQLYITLPTTFQGFSFPPQQIKFNVAFALTNGNTINYPNQSAFLCSFGDIAQSYNAACFCFHG